MRYEVYSINGLHGVARTQSKALAIASDLPVNTGGRFGILVKERKNSYPHSGIGGRDGVAYRHTMLLYPAGALCKKVTYDEWLKEVLSA